MHNSKSLLVRWTAVLLMISTLTSTESFAAARQEATLLTATEVMNELRSAPDQNVPNWLLDRAYAVVVVPNVLKVSVVLGGRRGTGVMVIRNEDGSWSNPVFINLTGGSVGFQVGVQSTDVMLVFTSKAGIEGIIGGKVTLGADASVAAGPVGRQTEAATDVGLNAQVYAYSRNKGLFAGVALDGSALTVNHKYNAEYYKKPGILASEILSAKAPAASVAAKDFIVSLGQGPIAAPSSTTGSTTIAPATSMSGSSRSIAKTTSSGGGLVSYPMEDKSPGSEPPK